MASYAATTTSPIGTLTLLGTGDALTHIVLPESVRPTAVPQDAVWDPGAFADVTRELAEYFAGTRQSFTVALAPQGTYFQLEVWRALSQIPFGHTWSYGDVAAFLGRRGASRAVGLANGANPLPLIVPCHRVIGADGSLTGFGGGLRTKRWLLDHERGATPLPLDPLA